MSLEFKTFLLNSYGAAASGRVEGGVGADVFRIDASRQSNKGDTSFPIYVSITGLDRFILDVAGLPADDRVEQLVRSKGGEVSTLNFGCCIRVTLETTDFEFVSLLSSIIRERLASGRKDPGSHDESVEAHMAESLHYFAGLLKQYSVQTRGIEKTRPDGLFAS